VKRSFQLKPVYRFSKFANSILTDVESIFPDASPELKFTIGIIYVQKASLSLESLAGDHHLYSCVESIGAIGAIRAIGAKEGKGRKRAALGPSKIQGGQ
jgi:hypothetical protein